MSEPTPPPLTPPEPPAQWPGPGASVAFPTSNDRASTYPASTYPASTYPASAYSASAYSASGPLQGRPGLIGAIGAFSILLSILSLLTCMMSGCQAYFFSTYAKITTTMNKSGSTPGAPTPAVANTDGLNAADRAAAIAALGQSQPLSEPRRAQLDRLLQDHGASIFPAGGQALTSQGVAVSITSSSTRSDDGSGDGGSTVYVTGWGTLRVFDGKAEFARTDGSTVSSSTSDPTSMEVVAAQASAGASALTAQQVQSAIDKAQQSTNNQLNAAQVDALRSLLSDPNQKLIAPQTAWSPVRMANVNPDGSCWLVFSQGYVSLDAAGRMQGNVNSTTPPKVTTPMPYFAAMGLDAALSAALAVFLFIAALAVMRQSPSGRRLHRIWASIKIPLVLIGGGIWWWTLRSFSTSAAQGNASDGGDTLVTMATVISLLGLIYPVILLIVLRSRTANDYYNAVGG